MKDKAVLFSLILLASIFIVGVVELNKQRNVSMQTDSGWDVSIRFDSAQQHPFYPFSKTAGIVGQTYYAQLNAADDLFEEYVGAECCAGPGWNNFPVIYEKEQARRPKGWYAERKPVDSNTYKILLRGVAWADCVYEELPYVKGELVVNVSRGWRIAQILKNSVTSSWKGQNTYCTIEGNSLRFASGNGCGNDCCICADSAWLDIELIVKKQ